MQDLIMKVIVGFMFLVFMSFLTWLMSMHGVTAQEQDYFKGEQSSYESFVSIHSVENPVYGGPVATIVVYNGVDPRESGYETFFVVQTKMGEVVIRLQRTENALGGELADDTFELITIPTGFYAKETSVRVPERMFRSFDLYEELLG